MNRWRRNVVRALLVLKLGLFAKMPKMLLAPKWTLRGRQSHLLELRYLLLHLAIYLYLLLKVCRRHFAGRDEAVE